MASCSKKCVQCEAFDAQNQKVSSTQKVCGTSFDMKNYKKRFEDSFENGYTSKCLDVD
jgi:hypothetical protein